LMAPDEPDIVMTDVAAAVELAALNVSVLLPLVLAGANTAVTPVGMPDADNATVPVNPPAGVIVMALVTVLPGLIVSAVGEADIANAGWLETPLRSSIRCCPAGVPQPVTRS